MLNPLSLLTPGQSAVIHWLPEQPAIVSRLLDLGFVPGAAVTCTLRRGNGSISAFLVRNAVIALRKEDAQLILAVQNVFLKFSKTAENMTLSKEVTLFETDNGCACRQSKRRKEHCF